MRKSLSLHIGVNVIDRESYGSTNYEKLCGAVNDAEEMCCIAGRNGFHEVAVLRDDKATFCRAEKNIRDAAHELIAGDTFLLTFSGHGARLLTRGPEETDEYDEGFVLHDLIMKDNYLDVLLRTFVAGTRIIIVADCCHSGTIYGFNRRRKKLLKLRPRTPAGNNECTSNRRLDAKTIDLHENRQNKKYKQLDKSFGNESYRVSDTIEADVIVLSACKDGKLAADGRTNGLFTQSLLDVLKYGGEPQGTPFTGTYKQFIEAISQKTGEGQIPQYSLLGPNSGDNGYAFFQGPPFSLIP